MSPAQTGSTSEQVSRRFRCSATSLEFADPLVGTASTIRAFLLLEAPGPWGIDAVRDSRLPREVKQRLTELESTHRVRPLLVRRHGRRATPGTRLFAAFTHTETPWVETVGLSDLRELLDLDLAGLGEGRRPGLAPHGEPLFLVCTHGRHDACCAERGRPLARAMSQVAPEETWEVSHIGGDRFAANLLVLPHGLYYGRLLPEDAAELVRKHRAGMVDLDHLRGRSAYPFHVQAAEAFLRRHLGAVELDPLPVEENTRQGADGRVVFRVEGRAWEVRVRTDLGDPRRLTCRAASSASGFAHRLLQVRQL